MPETVSIFGTIFAAVLLAGEVVRNADAPLAATAASSMTSSTQKISMDLDLGYADLTGRQVYLRAVGYFIWIYGVLLAAFLIGFVPALALSTLLFIRLHGSERWSTALSVSTGLFAFLWLVFDRIVHQAWPASVIGDLFPILRTVAPWF